MLPHSKRLQIVLFKEVILRGKSNHSPFFVLKTLNCLGSSRFSVSVSKKVAKSAVVRNKIRRRIYSSLTSIFPRIKDQIHGVFIVKPAIISATFKDISSEITNFFGKLGFLK